MGNSLSTGCGHFSKLPVTELALQVLGIALFPMTTIISTIFPNVRFSTNIGCILFNTHVVISHSPFCQLRKKYGPACQCRESNRGVQQKDDLNSW
jgi:hypothetical protein